MNIKPWPALLDPTELTPVSTSAKDPDVRRLKQKLNALVASFNAAIADIAENLAAITTNAGDILAIEDDYTTDTELAAWAGTTNVTTLGTIVMGVWQGTAIADGYIASASTWNAAVSDLSSHTGNTSNPHSVTKAQVSLTNVEDTAISTWAGTTNVTILGIIGTGTWQGMSIADGYITSASTWNAKQDARTISGTANQITVTGDTTMTLSTPQDIGTGSSVVFGGLQVTSGGTLTLAPGSITDSSGAISFGNENLTTTGGLAVGSTSRYTHAQLDVESVSSAGNFGAQMHLHSAGNTYGLFAGSWGLASAVISCGAHYYSGGSWLARNTSAAGIEFSGSSILIRCDSGKTPGNTYDPTTIVTVDTTGMTVAGTLDVSGAVTLTTKLADSSIASADTWNAKQDALTFSQSLDNTGDVITLDGDEAAPGTGEVYGTNSAGTKGWLTMTHSIFVSTDSIRLVNDLSAPGNSKLYGTNDSGTKGWQTLGGSLINLAGVVGLKNDETTPGSLEFYGTNGSGTKGWYNQSTITTVGTIGTGVWQGTAIADSYIASAATWNAKQNALPSGSAYEFLTLNSGGSAWITRNIAGTANQISISNTASTLTLSTPQNIGTTSNVQFGQVGCGVVPTAALDVNGPIRMR